jgi:hypothetical protein
MTSDEPIFPRIALSRTTRLSNWVTLVENRVVASLHDEGAIYHSIDTMDYVSVLALTTDLRVPLVRHQHLEAVGVDLYLDQQSIDTTTPMGKLVFQVTGAFAEFERSMIRQRIKAGLKRAVAQGARLGRPKVDVALERKAQKQLKKGVGILIAKMVGLGTGTVQRIKQEMGAL